MCVRVPAGIMQISFWSCPGLLMLAGAVYVGHLMATCPTGVKVPHIPSDSPLPLLMSWPSYQFLRHSFEFFDLVKRWTTPPDALVLDVATKYWQSEVTYALAALGVADELFEAGGELGCAEVARRLGDLQPEPLCRYMHAGASLGLLRDAGEEPPQPVAGNGPPDGDDITSRRFGLEVAGHLLRKNLPGSLHDYVLMMVENAPEALRSAGVETWAEGGIGWHRAHGAPFFEWTARRPEKHREFDSAMASLALTQAMSILGDWSPPFENATVCDIAGGRGLFLAFILQHWPGLSGILLDQNWTAEAARAHLEAKKVWDRVEVIAGSIFEPLAAELRACDVFVLKMILHDWSDAQSVTILRNILHVARRGARLDIVDIAIRADDPPIWSRGGILQDIFMLAVHGGRERTFSEFRALLRDAGVRSEARLTPLRGVHALVQAEL